MNYSSFIIRLIQKPQQILLKNEVLVVEAFAKFVPARKKKSIEIFKISIWGKLAKDLIKYYKLHDYFIIEGYISLREENLDNHSNISKDNKVEISIFKFYPFINI